MNSIGFRPDHGRLPAISRTAAAEGGIPVGFDLNVGVRTAISLRNVRRTLFGPDFYSGPAWGILLFLFESNIHQRRDTVGSVTSATALPGTTVLRWLSRLEQELLVHVRHDHLDRRRRYVELSQPGTDLMNRYFSGAAPHSIAA